MQLNKQDFKEVLQEEMTDIRKVLRAEITDVFFDRYKRIEVGTSTVAEICGVHPVTVTNWIKQKWLTPTNPGSSKYKFLLSDVLRKANMKFENV